MELGCLGVEKEGWFDPWALLSLFKNAAIQNGVNYIQAEVTDFVIDGNQQNDHQINKITVTIKLIKT